MSGGIFAVSVPGALAYGLALALAFYLGFAAVTRRWPRLGPRSLSFAFVMFMLFGAAG